MEDSNLNHTQFYLIEVHTGNSRKASTSADVSIELIDENGNKSGSLPITASNSNKNILNRNKASELRLLGNPIGFIKKIRITCFGKFHTWLLDHFVIRTMGHAYKVTYKDWLKNEVELEVHHIGKIWKDFAGGSLVLGPILGFRGMDTTTSEKLWRLSVMIATFNVSDPALLKFHTNQKPKIKTVSPTMYYEWRGFNLWRFDFDIELFNYAQVCSYSLGNGEITNIVEIPAIHEKPRMFFGSCIDRAHPHKMDFPSDRYATWVYLTKEHMDNPYHLVILGGDQVYADQIFTTSEAMRKWDVLPNKVKDAHPFTPRMRHDMETFYFHLYLNSWTQGMMPDVIAKIPTVMVWDDHDICDGWGSLQPEVLHSPVMQGLFHAARQAFMMFQKSGDLFPVINERKTEGPYNTAYNLTGNISLLLLDTRCERDMITHDEGIIMSKQSWECVDSRMLNLPRQIEHLFVVVTTPVVYPHRDMSDKVLDILNNENLDDSRDHWPAVIHKEEQTRLVNNCVKFMRDRNASCTILVGDVHCGALGTIRDRTTKDALITQFISSGMGSIPPPNAALFVFKNILKTKFNMEPNLRLQMDKIPISDVKKRYKKSFYGDMFLTTSNFLGLVPVPGRDRCVYKGTWYGVPPHDTPITWNSLPQPIMFSKETC